MMSFCCEPIIQATISGMINWSMKSRKVAAEQISLVLEACRLALITRWGGKHHIYFWEHGIDNVLLDLLLENSHNVLHQSCLSLEEQISIAQECLNSCYHLVLRNYIWDILGWLAIHYEEDFNHEIHGNKLSIDMLITCSWYCLIFKISWSLSFIVTAYECRFLVGLVYMGFTWDSILIYLPMYSRYHCLLFLIFRQLGLCECNSETAQNMSKWCCRYLTE